MLSCLWPCLLAWVSYLLGGSDMYLVKFKTSGIIAYRSLDRVQAQMWALLNDILDADGNPAGLYRIEKLKKPETVSNK